MNKTLMYTCIFIGSTVGSYIPVLFHQSFFSAASILCGGIGGVLGIWAAVKLNQYI